MHAAHALPTPLPRPCGRLLLALALAIMAPPRGAHAAPSIAVQDPIILRAPTAGPDMRQANPSTLYFVSHADCVDDLVLHFPVSMSGSPGDLRVFATSTGDCLTPQSRASGTGPSACSQIPVRHPSTTGMVDIPARDLVKVLGIDCDGMPSGGSARPEEGPAQGAQPLTLYFVHGAAADLSANPDAYARWTRTSIEVVPPPAPPLRLGTGHAELLVALPPALGPSMKGYYVFCYPLDLARGPAGGFPAGIGFPGSGTGAGAFPGLPPASGTGPSSCPPGTAALVDRAAPDVASPFVCASQVPASAGIVRITSLHDGSPLEDGRGYVVAAAAYDEVGNVGPLSPLVCGSPQPTDTFLKVYYADGGEGCAGCGICNAGARGGLPWPFVGAAALAAVGVIVRRDGRRRTRGPGRR